MPSWRAETTKEAEVDRQAHEALGVPGSAMVGSEARHAESKKWCSGAEQPLACRNWQGVGSMLVLTWVHW